MLEANACWELVRSSEIGRLAVSIGNCPDIFPVNFVVDHGTLVFRTAEGTKLAAAVLGETVAFEVDGDDAEAGEAWSVVMRGRAVEIEHVQDLCDALDLTPFPWHAAPKHRFVRIEPEDVSGRRFKVVDPGVCDVDTRPSCTDAAFADSRQQAAPTGSSPWAPGRPERRCEVRTAGWRKDHNPSTTG